MQNNINTEIEKETLQKEQEEWIGKMTRDKELINEIRKAWKNRNIENITKEIRQGQARGDTRIVWKK